MKKIALLLSVVAAAASLCEVPTAKALVAPLDTFSFALVGGNTASSTAYYLVSPTSSTFGTTTTTTGYDGQTITVTSSETIGATMTTDTFTISTPSSFINEATIMGTTINAIAFDIGDTNTSGDMVNLVAPIGPYTATGSTIYGMTGGSTATLTPNTSVSSNGMSYNASVGPDTGNTNTPASTYYFRSITYSITYANQVPEPSTWAMIGLGGVGALVLFRRRRTMA